MTITIAAVGDFMLQRRPRPEEIARVRALIAQADLAIANMDTVLSPLGMPTPKLFNLRGPREAAADVAAMGFHAVSFANNHAMDFGPEGMLDTIAALGEVGVTAFGAGRNLDEATTPHIVESNGRRIALLSMATTLPPDAPARPDQPGVAPIRVHQAYVVDPSIASEQPGSVPAVLGRLDPDDLARAVADVAAAKHQADVVVALPHWGVPSPWRAPFHPIVQAHQRELGRVLIEAGADAVIGNHAHELHGIEFHRGKPIAYCLGNFWIDDLGNYPWMGRETVVLRLSFADSSLPEVEFLPVVLDDRGWPQTDPENRAAPLLRERSVELGGVAVNSLNGLFRVGPAA